MKNSTGYRIACWSLSLVVALATCEACQAASSEAFRRWAVVGDTTTRESGISDLVTAELAQLRNVELVERDELQLAIQELELSQVYAASQSIERLKLGALINADALLLLSSGEHDGQPFVRVVTCDCVSGARLAYEQFTYSPARIDELASEVANTVSRTMARFPAGVQRLVTVSPFVSKDFLHDFDHLQNACSAWLSEVLTQQSGLAVVELEEARAIGRELSLTGRELSNGQKPLFIEGEYSSTASTDSMARAFQLSVSARDGSKVVLTTQSDQMKLEELSEWLNDVAGSQIIDHLTHGSSTRRTINHNEQVRMLYERADRFSRLGAYEQAIALREAAILLKSHSTAEMDIVRDYEALLRVRYLESAKWKNKRTLPKDFVQPESWESRFAGDLKLYRAVISHCQILLRHPSTNPRDYDEIFDAMFHRLPEADNLTNHAQEVLDIREAAFWKAVNVLSALSRSEHLANTRIKNSESKQDSQIKMAVRYETWVMRSLFYIFHQRANVPLSGLGMVWRTNDTLDVFERFLSESQIPNCPSSQIVRSCIGSQNKGLASSVQSGAISKDNLLKLQRALMSSDDPVRQFYGRCLDSSIRWHLQTGNIANRKQSRVDDLKNLEHWLLQWLKIHPESMQSVRFSGSILQTTRKREASDTSSLAQHEWPATPQPVSGSDPFPDLLFERLPVQADWRQLIPCTPEFDLVWSSDSVARLDSSGKPVVLYKSESPTDQICRVAWDGQFVWIGSSSFGVRILSEDGRLLAEIPQGKKDATGKQGLPQWERNRVVSSGSGRLNDASPRHTFRLVPVSPGCCLVSARYGSHSRRWIAVIDFADDDWSVDVLHQSAATGTNVLSSSGYNTDGSLMPKWFLPVQTEAGRQVTKLLMGRGLFNSNRIKRTPLLIDVESRKVTSLSNDFVVPALGPSRPTILTDGAAVIPDYFGCWLLKPSSDTESGWSSQEISFSKLGPGRDQSLPWGVVSRDRIIFPGPVWRSLDPDTGNVERINAKPLAPQWEFEDYAASGPFGLVAWNRGDHLYRVHVKNTKQNTVALADRYPSVPKEMRARHHAAVTRLRELGATVELSWGRFVRSRFLERRASEEWRSVALFPPSWEGNDRDFALVRDVYNLRELALVGAPATDTYCSIIGQLKGLHHLSFEGTQVTDAGLKQLGKLPELTELRLQSRDGHADFTNAAFNVVTNLPGLERLIVYGDGFTDEGLKVLPRQVLFHRLCLLDTEVSDAAIAKLRSSRRNFMVKRHVEYNRP